MSNGSKGWSPLEMILTLFIAGMVGIVGWLFDSVVKLREFATYGKRFSLEDAVSMENRIKNDLRSEMNSSYPPRWLTERVNNIERAIEKITEEDKRLQLQIDRLEGHKPKGYTTDDYSYRENEDGSTPN